MKKRKSKRMNKKHELPVASLRRIVDEIGSRLQNASEDARQIAKKRFGTKALRAADVAVNEVRRRLAPAAANLHSWCEVENDKAAVTDKKE